ncbi:MAG TPA: hypothetical protein VGL91_25900 [Acidobacteriota bacterium]
MSETPIRDDVSMNKLLISVLIALAVFVAGCNRNKADTTGSNVKVDHKKHPPPASSSEAVTHAEMKNVDFHVDDTIILRIKSLRGVLLRTNKETPPVFDDKKSFIIRIDSGTIGIRTDSLTDLLNNYVFAYPHAPLKKLNISVEGNQIKQTGIMHKVADVPFAIVGNLSATPEGKIRLHPSSIKAAGIPVKGLMHLFDVELSELIKVRESRGVKIDNNDLILDPELMVPPPEIRGRVTAVRIEGDEVIQTFGPASEPGGSTRHVTPSNPKAGNYMYYQGGTLRFGKLTMTNADLQIVDANPKDDFDFSLEHYNRQLVAGYSKNTPNFGLVVFMPDYYKVREMSPKTNQRTGTGGNFLKPPNP